MVIEDHGLLAAATGGDGETSSLVFADFTSQFDCLNKHLMDSDWGSLLDWEDKRLCGDGKFGRAFVMPVLFEASFRSFEQLEEVFTHQLRS